MRNPLGREKTKGPRGDGEVHGNGAKESEPCVWKKGKKPV